eukprot:CAMPEP_0113312114 /NCGR_PEP_ID=MMETSP0010_2-20120614/9070_1 /TAXON_ID=216773 ORGANISM="Corethron hystrix, Strain 308" /NCGR_SAMPLE_ID=MMETSP0010_2 /ASSEMBLY_ACC=CAM_ASM_000155 /LENGTH=519 /DNA_ID=CAMNT_0000167867 /DNA_START=110 /DNA_END=1669 /DNA_ORIENTATION=+ /assembly_acc=CAM_ASM_000155
MTNFENTGNNEGISLNHYLALAKQYAVMRTATDSDTGMDECADTDTEEELEHVCFNDNSSEESEGLNEKSLEVSTSAPPSKDLDDSESIESALCDETASIVATKKNTFINDKVISKADINNISNKTVLFSSLPSSSLDTTLLSLNSSRLLSPTLFPCKLHSILSSSQYSFILNWAKDGKSWRVYDTTAFMEVIAPKYFKMKKFASFVRMVYLWGFVKMSGGFFHEHFQQGKVMLCQNMVLRKNKRKNVKRGKSVCNVSLHETDSNPSSEDCDVETASFLDNAMILDSMQVDHCAKDQQNETTEVHPKINCESVIKTIESNNGAAIRSIDSYGSFTMNPINNMPGMTDIPKENNILLLQSGQDNGLFSHGMQQNATGASNSFLDCATNLAAGVMNGSEMFNHQQSPNNYMSTLFSFMYNTPFTQMSDTTLSPFWIAMMQAMVQTDAVPVESVSQGVCELQKDNVANDLYRSVSTQAVTQRQNMATNQYQNLLAQHQQMPFNPLFQQMYAAFRGDIMPSCP